MSDLINDIIADFAKTMARPVPLAYCDYIAHRIHHALLDSHADTEKLIDRVGSVQLDLHPELGYFLTTKKTIELTDRNGKRYRVTVEEIAP